MAETPKYDNLMKEVGKIKVDLEQVNKALRSVVIKMDGSSTSVELVKNVLGQVLNKSSDQVDLSGEEVSLVGLVGDLVELGVDIKDGRHMYRGAEMTLLHIAVDRQNIAMARALLENGADIESYLKYEEVLDDGTDVEFATPLSFAIINKNVEMFTLLHEFMAVESVDALGAIYTYWDGVDGAVGWDNTAHQVDYNYLGSGEVLEDWLPGMLQYCSLFKK